MSNSTEKLIGFHSGYLDATVKAQRLIENLECDEVWLSVWNVSDDGLDTRIAPDAQSRYETTDEEIFWGFDNNCVHQLFPGEIVKGIPVDNAKDIFVRANRNKGVDKRRVAFSCFKKVKVKQNQDENYD